MIEEQQDKEFNIKDYLSKWGDLTGMNVGDEIIVPVNTTLSPLVRFGLSCGTEDHIQTMIVLRVPGGWLMTRDDDQSIPVFVPYNEGGPYGNE